MERLLNAITPETLVPIGAPAGSWKGLPAYLVQNISEIRARLPWFERRPFLAEQSAAARAEYNPHYDVVVRVPLNPLEPEVPVGIVSKKYSLVQHRLVFENALEALALNGVTGEIDAELLMTTFGERADFAIMLPPSFDLDPGDGHPLRLRLHCINSVEGSTRITLAVGWLRLVCRNGMIVGTATAKLQQVHNVGLNARVIAEALHNGLKLAVADRRLFTQWAAASIEPRQLDRWVDGAVRRAWGVKAAVRVRHIVMTGHDCDVQLGVKRTPASRMPVTPGQSVPGAAAGALTAFAACQALSWIVRSRRDHHERLELLPQIPGLMRALLN